MRTFTFVSTWLASAAVLLSVFTPAMADVSGDVAKLMEGVRKKETVDSSALRKAPPGQVLAELRKHLKDPNTSVRMMVLGLASGIASRQQGQASNPNIRKQAARLIFDVGVLDSDTGIARHAAQDLLDFSHDDFTDDMRRIVHQVVSEKSPLPEAVRLAGVADVRSAIPQLRAFVTRGNYWDARLALARMGDKEQIQYCINRIESEPDQIRKKTSFVEDLAYLRQPEAVEILIGWLFSDEMSPPSPPDVPSAKYAAHALEQLKEIIEGFPKLYEPGDSGDDEIVKARQWITQQGGAAKLKIKR